MKDTNDTTNAQTPVWIRIPVAVQLTGISRSTLYAILAAGKIRSASLRDPGQRHAVRLIDRADLLAFIESRATGGVVAK